MAAAEVTETVYNVTPNLGSKIAKVEFTAATATTGDWVIFDDPIGCIVVNDKTGAVGTQVYATGSGCNVATATATTLTDGTFTASQRPASGYLMVGTEIVKYSGATKTSDTGTLTLDARGCFGTTAAQHTTAAAYVLNTLVFTVAAGPIRGIADIIGE